MKPQRLRVVLGIFGLLAAVASLAMAYAQEAGGRAFRGGSYLITIQDSAGNFASRGIVTLHADRTMSITNSGQQGPSFFFSSQLGSWRPDGNRGVVARALDFDYPPNPDIARVDYAMSIAQDHRRVSGTITLATFPLESGNPLEGEGTLIGNFTFVGESIEP